MYLSENYNNFKIQNFTSKKRSRTIVIKCPIYKLDILYSPFTFRIHGAKTDRPLSKGIERVADTVANEAIGPSPGFPRSSFKSFFNGSSTRRVYSPWRSEKTDENLTRRMQSKSRAPRVATCLDPRRSYLGPWKRAKRGD